MKIAPIFKYNFFCFSIILLSSCSNTKNLPADDTLYLGSSVSIKDSEAPAKQKKVLKSDLEGAVRPKPNTKVLGVRLKLSIYNLGGKSEKNKGIRKIFRDLGEQPVLASSLDLAKNEEIFINFLENKGFFYPSVTSRISTDSSKRKTKGYFEVYTGPQYKIKNVEFPSDSSQLSLNIASVKDKTLLKPGQPFNLDLIKGERDRITKALTEKGYYYFKSDYILVKADTSIGNFDVNMYVTLKQDEMPEQAYNIYKINDVFIYPNFRLNAARADTNKNEANFYKGYYVVDRRKTFKPYVFKQTMQFQPGDVYNRTEQNLSLNRLVNLGVFKFVKNRFEAYDNPADPKLDIYYYLTPYPRKSLRFEIGVESQNDSRLGTQANISWRNRNAFHGAELLALTLRGGYEAQAGGASQRPSAFEGGAEVSLSIPRFIIPFLKIVPSNMYVPRTTIKLGYDATLRRDLYLIHSLKGSYGYVFKEDIRKEHQLFPININYVRTDTLAMANEQNINYSNLIFNGLIIGPTYEYTFNSQAAGLRRNNYYFNGLIDFSNNILGLAQGASQEVPKEIFGTKYAQYMKYQADGRYYLNYALHKNNMWANRVLLGFGYPYGNSTQLPNIKQFFSGGASSLRGFRSRLVGPGTFNEKYLYPDAQPQFIETLGDVKLELSSELRIHVYQFINTAFFIDAGNIWTYYDDARFPGGKFTHKFFNELAADAGVGLRLDFDILILRLDFAMPIRKPWFPEGDRWAFNKIDFGSGSWRRENLIFNLAIGYPF